MDGRRTPTRLCCAVPLKKRTSLPFFNRQRQLGPGKADFCFGLGEPEPRPIEDVSAYRVLARQPAMFPTTSRNPGIGQNSRSSMGMPLRAFAGVVNKPRAV